MKGFSTTSFREVSAGAQSIVDGLPEEDRVEFVAALIVALMRTLPQEDRMDTVVTLRVLVEADEVPCD